MGTAETLAKATEAAAEKKRNQTHCKHGHEYTEENTYRRRNGGRACRQCALDATADSKVLGTAQMLTNPNDPRHGTMRGYALRCPCTRCRYEGGNAKRAQERARRAEKRGLIG